MKGWNEIAVSWIMVGCLLSMSGVTFVIVELAVAQTTKSRAKVDANKKWELVNDQTGNVLASCDASLKCEVSDQLKQMIVCHEQMQKALRALDNQEIMESAELQRIMQECVTAQ